MNTPKDTLQQAQLLLKNKQYDQARNLLQSISSHPTAQQWLAKLDQIAPVNGDQAQLARAQQLLKDKRYDEARVILEDLPFNTTAEKWLERLNQIAPKTSAVSEYDAIFNSYTAAPKPPASRSFSQDLPEPQFSASSASMGFNGMSQQEKENLVYVNKLIKQKNFDRARQILKSMPNNPFAQESLLKLEEIAPRPKKETGKVAAAGGMAVFGVLLRNRLVMRLFVAAVVLVGSAVYGFIQAITSADFEGKTVIVEYSNSWKPQKINEIGICTESNHDCSLVIGIGTDTRWSMMSFTEVEWTGTQTLDGAEAGLWNEFTRGEDWGIPVKTMKIAGKDALVREIQYNDPDDIRHFMIIHLMSTPTTTLEIIVWTYDEASFTHYYDDILKVLNGMKFKNA